MLRANSAEFLWKTINDRGLSIARCIPLECPGIAVTRVPEKPPVVQLACIEAVSLTAAKVFN